MVVVFVRTPVAEIQRGDTVRIWGGCAPAVIETVDGGCWVLDNHRRVEIHPNDRVRVLRPLAVGLPATVMVGCDAYPATVVGWSKSGRVVQVTPARLLRVGGRAEGRALAPMFDPNIEGERETFTRRKDGAYRAKGRRSLLSFGERRHVIDPSF